LAGFLNCGLTPSASDAEIAHARRVAEISAEAMARYDQRR
jgi:hypothetical protein